MSEQDIKIAKLEQNDIHIKDGMDRIEKLLAKIHKDNNDFFHSGSDRLTILEVNNNDNDKKITDLQSAVEIGKARWNRFIGWTIGVSTVSGGIGAMVAKSFGLIH